MTTRANIPKRNPWPWILGGAVAALVGPPIIFRAFSAFGYSALGRSALEIAVVLLAAGAWVLGFRRSRPAAFGALIGATIGCAVLFIMAFAVFDGLGRGTDYANLEPAKLGTNLGLEIPASATNVSANQVSWQDTFVHARFEISRDELEKFLSVNHLKLETTSPFQFENKSLDRAWWKPEDGTRVGVYRLALDPKKPDQEKLSKTGYSVSVQVNQLEPGRVVVYIQAFST